MSTFTDQEETTEYQTNRLHDRQSERGICTYDHLYADEKRGVWG